MEEKAMFTNELHQQLLDAMPYKHPFLFVDQILHIDEKTIKTTYFFHDQHDFYQGHFKDKPITPGAILLECMGQTGCVLHGIYLFGLHKTKQQFEPILGLMEGNFFYPVYPNTLVYIESELDYIKGQHISAINHLYDDMQNLIAISRIQCKFEIYEK